MDVAQAQIDPTGKTDCSDHECYDDCARTDIQEIQTTMQTVPIANESLQNVCQAQNFQLS